MSKSVREQLKEKIKAGATIEDIQEWNFGLWLGNRQSIEIDISNAQPDRSFKTMVSYFYGETVTGKSHLAAASSFQFRCSKLCYITEKFGKK